MGGPENVKGGVMVVALASSDLLRMEDVEKAFGVKEKCIRRWIATRGFPGVKVDRVWRFDPVAVAAWDEARLAAAQAEKVAV